MPSEMSAGNSGREYSLTEALEKWSEPTAWSEFRELEKKRRQVAWLLKKQESKEIDGEEMDILAREKPSARRANEAFDRLVRSLFKQLEQGKLVAHGYVYPRKLRSKRQQIPADLWPRLRANFETSLVFGDGLRFVDVVVRQMDAMEPNIGIARVGKTALERWYAEYVEDCRLRGVQPTREEDVAAAKAHFGARATVRPIRALRRAIAPKEWSRKGRRPKIQLTD